MNGYERVRKIGRGSFGDVFIVRSGDSEFVMKEIKVSLIDEEERLDVLREVELLGGLNHPNVVSYFESFLKENRFYIIMEYCESGDLFSKINSRKGKLFPEEQVLKYFTQIARAVEYVHSQNILHRDIKSQNILLKSNGVVKLGDFGIAKIMDGTTDYARTCIGTPFYLSPEIWENKPYNQKSDIWALGCVLYELTTLKHAFEAGCMKNLVLKIIKGTYPSVPSIYSYDLRNLIGSLLKKNPHDRPELENIFRKTFIKKAEEYSAQLPPTLSLKGRKTINLGLTRKIHLTKGFPYISYESNSKFNQTVTIKRPKARRKKNPLFNPPSNTSNGAMWIDFSSPTKEQKNTDPSSERMMDTFRKFVCTGESLVFENQNSGSYNQQELSTVEHQRAYLENRLGTVNLLKAYKLLAEENEDCNVYYHDLKNIVGVNNENLIDQVVQLVVADQVYYSGN